MAEKGRRGRTPKALVGQREGGDGVSGRRSVEEDAASKVGRFQRVGTRIGALVEKKNAAYGDSFAQSGGVLRILYPDGVKPSQYTDMLGIVRVLDKLFRIATHKGAFEESPWDDVAGYGVLGAARAEMSKALSAPEDFWLETAVSKLPPGRYEVEWKNPGETLWSLFHRTDVQAEVKEAGRILDKLAALCGGEWRVRDSGGAT